MNVGLLTFYHIHHYGAFMQAYATQQAVQALGSNCTVLEYYVNQNNDLFRKSKSLGAVAANVHTTAHYQALKRRHDRFEATKATYLQKTPQRFLSSQDLAKRCPDVDVLLSGSDQIWNPKIFPDGHFDPVFFGQFSDKRKIAYAPSFGIPKIPQEMEGELAGYLNTFSHIGVRERQGAAIVHDVAGKTVPVVLDPTLLLTKSQWGRLAKKPNLDQGYILCYCISKVGALSSYIRRLAEETGLPVVQLCGIRQKVHPKAHCVLDAGPQEFLGLFQNASYVCTNSFHGTVFSTVFGKPFFSAVSPAEMAAPQRSRTFSLLSTLGLAQRIIGKGDTAGVLEEIDWAAVEENLTKARSHSLSYLQAALDNVPFEPAQDVGQALPFLPKLASHDTCTGCSACATTCPAQVIEMVRDGEGFAYPQVNTAGCLACNKCTTACPVLDPVERNSVPVVYAAWNSDDRVRKLSTSGGMFYLLAKDMIAQGGVVFGASFDSKMHLRHTAAFTLEQCKQFRGAKYVQSDLTNVYAQVETWLRSRPVLFSGTPCQVDGLYHYLGNRPENLTTCDLICHGVPSPGVWEDTVKFLAKKAKSPIQSVEFRHKVAGWHKSHMTICYDNGCLDSAPLFDTPYGRAFGRGLMLRPSCHTCPYTTISRVGDFTLGDFWGLGKEELSKQQEKGISLLMVNTAHGSHVFDQLPMERVKYSVEKAVAGNPRLISPLPRPAERANFFAAYGVESFDIVFHRYYRVPKLPMRVAAKALSPEVKAKLRKVIKR